MLEIQLRRETIQTKQLFQFSLLFQLYFHLQEYHLHLLHAFPAGHQSL